MATNNGISSVIGTDGQPVVYDPNSLWKIWEYDEVYLGGIGAGKWVPKVKDMVFKISGKTKEEFVVTALDMSTLIPTLTKVANPIDPGPIPEEDRLLAPGPGPQSLSYRIYIDKSVTPHAFAVDQRLYFLGTMTKHVIIYRGSEAGLLEPISMMYDQSGNFLGNKIPLELVDMPNSQNLAVKCIPTAYTVEDLPDGEVVIAIAYSDDGHVVSKQQLVVENTAFIRSANKDIKYVSHISLESPFMSQSNPNELVYPINVPIEGLNLMGVVHYSDNSTVKMPVDGNKFQVFGLEQYVATIIDQPMPMVIAYNLGPNEVAYGAIVGDDKKITASYRARTLKADKQYALRLHGYPVWVSAANEYRLEWFLHNLDRGTVYNATNFVRINDNSPPFKPSEYGTNQRLSVSVDLSEIDGRYRKYRHVQTIDIVLRAQGSEPATNWTVADPGQPEVYGVGLECRVDFVNQNLKRLKLGSGALNKAEWIKRVYYNANPLVNPDTEIRAPEPDFFILQLGGQNLEFPISRWNDELVISAPISNSDTLFIRFIRRMPNTDLQLVTSAMPVHFNP